MTFAVIDTDGTNETVVGTIWADAESEARTIASDLLNFPEPSQIIIRRAEEREIPLKPFN